MELTRGQLGKEEAGVEDCLTVIVIVGDHLEVHKKVVGESGADVGSVKLEAEEDEAAESHDA